MKERIAQLLDYMTRQQALALGFTNHGAMYGIPCWVGETDAKGPMVAAKWGPAEYLISLGHWVTGLTLSMLGREPYFRIRIGREIR